jgi:uncharacterized protein (AIM24 family)
MGFGKSRDAASGGRVDASGGSACQVEGEIVPVAEIRLAASDWIYFEHHVMLWKDDGIRLSVMPMPGGMQRALAGLPFIISVAQGPGRIAFSRDATGELVVVPLHPGVEFDVREHAFLLASHQISYSFVRIQGLRNILFGGQGQLWRHSAPVVAMGRPLG